MIKCETCGKELDTIGKYAGHVSGHVRRGEVKKGTGREAKRINAHRSKHCKICGKEFENAFFRHTHERFDHKPWEQIKGPHAMKKRLILEGGRFCSVCKLDSWNEKPIPIEIDHIDGNPENTSKENIRLICPNCHAQTDTYRGKNVGKVLNSKRKGIMKKYRYKYR